MGVRHAQPADDRNPGFNPLYTYSNKDTKSRTVPVLQPGAWPGAFVQRARRAEAVTQVLDGGRHAPLLQAGAQNEAFIFVARFFAGARDLRQPGQPATVCHNLGIGTGVLVSFWPVTRSVKPVVGSKTVRGIWLAD